MFDTLMRFYYYITRPIFGLTTGEMQFWARKAVAQQNIELDTPHAAPQICVILPNKDNSPLICCPDIHNAIVCRDLGGHLDGTGRLENPPPPPGSTIIHV
jgi:hypothetical protein